MFGRVAGIDLVYYPQVLLGGGPSTDGFCRYGKLLFLEHGKQKLSISSLSSQAGGVAADDEQI
jgi:hypothetical protein